MENILPSNFIKFSLLICIFFTLASCTSVNSKVGGVLNLETDLKLSFEVASDINPDESDKPSPLYVRLYELKSDRLFKKAEFISMYERDEEVLGADLISKQELKRILPGEDRQEWFVLDEDTRYVGIFAEFFRYKDANYKAVFPVTANNVIRNAVKIQISGDDVIILDEY